ncbi:protein mono-ADP-ribosyltransferase PARP12-like isoform X2 [Ranitomeya imitator]|uniref:protein mono-ADP-ribosyltransferase PARP12-like isoform X2 n=1 Tax=Ranitomeya imitator TaxID=111125 RepID=UPI0037E923EB
MNPRSFQWLEILFWPEAQLHCNFSHDISSDYNQFVLKVNEINGLNIEEVKVLLFQNDNTMLPEVCMDYMNFLCVRVTDCPHLHICEAFIRGECNRSFCVRSHKLLNLGAGRCQISEISLQNFQILCELKHNENLKMLMKAVPMTREKGNLTAICNSSGERKRKNFEDGPESKIPTIQQVSAGMPAGLSSVFQQDLNTTPVTSSTTSPFIRQSVFTFMNPSTAPTAGHSTAPSSCTRVNSSPTKGPPVPLENRVDSIVRSQTPVPPIYMVPDFYQPNPDRVQEICLSNLWKYCSLGKDCPDMHYYLPYRWQIHKGTDWEDVPNMEEVEKCYCDPKVDSVPLIDFLTMRSGGHHVRRLSTVSSVVKPSEYVLTTEWLWFWRDEYGSWTQYGQSIVNRMSATISSSYLENIYLADANAVLPFAAGIHSYEMSFRDMKQKNVMFKTERDVRRRPKFLNFDDVKLLRGSTRSAAAESPLKLGTSPLNLGTPPVKSGTSPMNNDFYPKTWDLEAMPEIGCKKVLVSDFSIEFLEIVSSFSKTVRRHEVKKIWRLQNPSLWQVFQWQKEQMKKVNQGGDVKEMQLFHGTDSTHIDAICDQNFDWRICGTHGTVHGQGSYFARDASYSHIYSAPTSSGTRAMFVARVLVGDYVTGNFQMKRPPLRPGSSSQYYDSCVDNTTDPSIFVVFEKHQIYPEYLLEYEEEQENY